MTRSLLPVLLLIAFVSGCASKQAVPPKPLPPSVYSLPVLPPLKKLDPELLEPSFLDRLESILYPRPYEPTPSGSN